MSPKEEINLLSGTDIFNLFNLENGDDIDFETAYKMISDFDHETALPKLNFNDFHMGVTASSPSIMNGAEPQSLEELQINSNEIGNDSNKELHGWTQQIPETNIGYGKNFLNSTEVAHPIGPSSKSGLLSTFESNAIEHFLDNLIVQDEGEHNTVSSKTYGNTEKHPLLETDKSIRSSMHVRQAAIPMKEETYSEYKAPLLQIPEITVSDSDAPTHVMNDPKSLRKWKHVEVERLRRNKIKSTFEELIALTKYPRGEENKILKPSTEKRVPKHTLLSFVVDDIKSILQANQQLTILLHDIERAEKQTGKNNILPQ